MDGNIQAQLSSGRIDQAEEALHIGKFMPPPTAAEIDFRHELALHRDTARKIQVDIDDFFPNDGKTRYSNAYVLLLCWADEEPKLPVSLELDRLQDVFSGWYGFSTEKWEIPLESSHNKLAAKIMEFIELGDDSRRDLKIIYYGGHGMLNKGRQPVWMNLPDSKDKAFRHVVWGGIQTNLEQAQSDVLILLDCCESGTANTDFGCGTTELIAACGFDAAANPVGSDSFTHNLIEELIDLSGGAPFTVSLLYNNILSRLSKWMPDRSGVKRKSPVHVTLTQNSKLPRPIQLSPRLVSSTLSSKSTVSVGESNTRTPLAPNLEDNRDWSLGACLTSIPDMSCYSDLKGLPRLAVNIWLQKPMSLVDLQVETMGDWIRMMPVLAERVQIGPGVVDYCNLFKFIQETFPDALRQNTENSLPAMKSQVSLTQATLQAASTALDEMMAQKREARVAAERLQNAVSQGLADVSVEIRAQGDKVAESATAISNSLDTGFKSLRGELSKQGGDMLASSERIERCLQGTEQSLQTLLLRLDDEYHAHYRIHIPTQLPALEEMMESAVTRGIRKHESMMVADKNLSPAATAMLDVARPAIKNLGTRQRRYLLSHRVRKLDARHFGLVLEMVASENNSSIDIKVFNKAVRLTIAWGRESAQLPIYQFQISTYNVVPYTCPLFKACRALNCAEVYRLFAHGLASPHDRAFHDGLYLSPIDEIVNVVARTRTHAESVEGLSLLKFLFEAGAHPAVRPEGVTEIFMDCSSFRPQIYQEQDIDRLESLQVLLEYGEDTILEGTGVAGFLTVENEQVPVFGYLSPTEDWRINWEQMPYCSSERIFGETDRTMLLDPECKRIKAAISDGKEYVAFHPEFIIDKKLYLIGPLHSLILQASRSQLYEVHECCRLRISILLRHGLDPRTLCWLFDERGNRRLEVSPTRYAQDLGSMDLWTDALKMSGWDEAEIETLIDEETYAGISGLLSGTVSYLDRDTCRRAFLRRLRAGDFRRMAHEILEDECKTLQFNLGLWDFQSIVEMVQNSSIEYFIKLTKRIPGSWLDDGGTMDILHEPIPGVDYELPQWSIDGDLIDWSKYLDDNDTQDVGNDMQEEGTDGDHLQEELEDDDDEDECWHDALSDEAEITGATQRRTIWGFNDV